MHLTEAGIALCHSFRAEQTAVLGFLLAVDKVLLAVQRGCLESSSYPWSPEWLKLCILICRKKGRQPHQYPAFGHQQLQLPILPHKSAFEVQYINSINCFIARALRTARLLISGNFGLYSHQCEHEEVLASGHHMLLALRATIIFSLNEA